MQRPPLKVFWYRKPKPGNFGDILTPLLLKFYGYDVEHAAPEEADYVMVGSIAKIIKPRHTVMGSGVMTSDPILCKDAQWLWCRGPRTRRAVLANGGTCPEIYGDPALLLPKFVPPAGKKYPIGITPHYIDYQQVKDRYSQYRVINLLNEDPLTVIREITECEKIISSSLHGIIAAHAYGIPAAWVKFDGKLAGDDTKFHDHYEAFDRKAELGTIDDPIFATIDYNMSLPHDILREGKI
jgi:pyruvyltransferase